MVYITGDTHGEKARFRHFPNEAEWTAHDVLIVCGDFGFLFADNLAERRFLDKLEEKPYTICFVDGNHENFPAICRCPVEEWNGGRVHRIRRNVFHLMRGQIFLIQGHSWFTFGGAYSVDRYMRELGKSYWEEELPSDAEYKEAAANLQAHGMRVDYVLTHTAPREMVLRLETMLSLWSRPEPKEAELEGFLEYLMYEVDHQHWYCGHWHQDYDMSEKFSFLWFDVKEIPPKE